MKKQRKAQKQNQNKKANREAAKPAKKQEKLSFSESIFKLRHYAWAFALFLVSFSYYKDSFEAFQGYRFLVYNTFLLLYAIAFFLLKPADEGIRIKSSTMKAFFAVGGLFCGWSIFVSFFSVNAYESLFPIAQVLSFGVGVFFIAESLSEEGAFTAYAKTISTLMLLLSIIGILQALEAGFLKVPGSRSMPTGFSGNRNLFGGFLAAGLPIVAWTAIRTKGVWKWLSAIATILTFTTVILSQTRTAWISAIAAIAMLAIGWLALQGRQNFKQAVKPLAIGLAVIIGAFSLLIATSPNLRENLTKRAETIQLLFDFDNEESMQKLYSGRWSSWIQAIKIFKDHPAMGVGVDNWKIHAPLYYDKESFRVQTGQVFLLHSHNIYLQTLSETGAIGLLLYLGMLGILIFTILGTMRSKSIDRSVKINALFLGGSLVAILFDGLASFGITRIEHALLFTFVSAGILAVGEKKVATAPPFSLKKQWIVYLTIPIIIYGAIMGYSRLDFGVTFMKMRQAMRSSDHQTVVKLAHDGTSALTKLTDMNVPLEMYAAISYRELKQFDKSLEKAHKALEYHPNNTNILNTVGNTYLLKKDYENALLYFNESLSFTPLNPIPKRNLALCYFFTEDYENAIRMVEEAGVKNEGQFKRIYIASMNKLNRPIPEEEPEATQKITIPAPQQNSKVPEEIYRAISYRNQGKFNEALQEAFKAFKDYPENAAVLNTIGTIYVTMQDYSNAMPYLNKSLTINPSDPAPKRNLAFCYYFTQDYERAIKVIEELGLQNTGQFQQIHRESQNQLRSKK